MSLEKAIESGKERRKPYRGSRAIDGSCRNRGSCPWCAGKRRYKRAKQLRVDERVDVDLRLTVDP